jgi:ATP adenylyltransferase
VSEPRTQEPLESGTLWSLLRERTRSALASGALHAIASELHVAEADGVPILVRVLGPRLDDGRAAAARQRARGFDPFLPYEDEMFVAHVSASHVALLNKYSVLPHHLLIVTRAFRSQDEPLDADDLEALWKGLEEIDGLAFYNGGAMAGASQPHKHLQIVPTPLGAGAAPIPIEPLLASSVPEEGIGRCSALPFPHAVASTASLASLRPDEAARPSVELIRAMAESAAPGGTPRAYNLLVTRRFALFVPRVFEAWEGISVNSLGFAGSMLVRDRADLERIRRRGPLAVLGFVAGAANEGTCP